MLPLFSFCHSTFEISLAGRACWQTHYKARFETLLSSQQVKNVSLKRLIYLLYVFFLEFSPDALLERTHGLLNKLSYLDHLYSLGQTENWALEKVKEHIPLLCDWAENFVAPFPHPDQGTMDFKTPEYQHVTEQPSVCISSLRDIEENIWSPRYGLKGMQQDCQNVLPNSAVISDLFNGSLATIPQ